MSPLRALIVFTLLALFALPSVGAAPVARESVPAASTPSAAAPAAATPAATPDTAAAPVMRVHFVNVGQGAATLVELPCGAMLVDTGGELSSRGTFDGTAELTAYLDAFFSRRADLSRTLDLLVLTHPHIDHVRGARAVLDTTTVRNLVDNGQVATQEDAIIAMDAVRAWQAEHPAVPYRAITTEDIPGAGAFSSPVLDPFAECRGVDPVVSALWGQVPRDPGWGEDDYNHPRFANENNHSVVTRVTFGAASVLITGDLEEVAIRDLVNARSAAALDADIYVVGHHGSANGTTADLLRVVTPAWAVLEMGPSTRHEAWTAWQYGHPRRDTIELLEREVTGTREGVYEPVANGVKDYSDRMLDRAIYATGWDGTIVLEADASGTIRRVEPDR